MVRTQGGMAIDSTFVLPVFDDTAAANRGTSIKVYKGAMIRTRNPNNTVWMRDSTLSKWNLFGAGLPQTYYSIGTYSTNFTSDIFTQSGATKFQDNLGSGISKTFNANGLSVSGTTSSLLQNSWLELTGYGMVYSNTLSQDVIFKVNSTSINLDLAIGTRTYQEQFTSFHNLNRVYVNGGSITISSESPANGGTATATMPLYAAGDVVRVSVNYFPDSIQVQAYNLTQNTYAAATRRINWTNQYFKFFGRNAIFIKQGDITLMNFVPTPDRDFDAVVFGNSIAQGYNMPNPSSVFSVMQKTSNLKIINFAMAGSGSFDYKPGSQDYNFYNKTVLLYGVQGNDNFFGRTLAQSRADYDTLVQRLRANNNRIIHFYVTPRSIYLGSLGAAFVDSVNAGLTRIYGGVDEVIDYPADFNIVAHTADGVHLNAAGTKLVSDTMRYDLPLIFQGSSSGVPVITASNGLTKTGNDIALGGALTGSTSITYGPSNASSLSFVNNLGSLSANSVGTDGTVSFLLDHSVSPPQHRVSVQNTGGSQNFTQTTTKDSLLLSANGTLISSFGRNGNIRFGAAGVGQIIDTSANKPVTIDVAGNIRKGYWFGGGASQWTSSGSSIYYNTGNVGINTASPISRLHINGSLRLGDTISLNDGGYTSTPARIYKVDAPTLRMDGVYLSIYSSHPGGNITLQTVGGIAYMNATGQLLLGSYVATGSEKLHVAGGAQITGSTAIGSSAPNASAALDVQSTTKGFLLPRMTTAQINAISSPPTGLLVFNTDINHVCLFIGTWRRLTDAAM